MLKCLPHAFHLSCSIHRFYVLASYWSWASDEGNLFIRLFLLKSAVESIWLAVPQMQSHQNPCHQSDPSAPWPPSFLRAQKSLYTTANLQQLPLLQHLWKARHLRFIILAVDPHPFEGFSLAKARQGAPLKHISPSTRFIACKCDLSFYQRVFLLM